MKNIFFGLLLLACINSHAQSSQTTDNLTVRKGITLNGKKITDVQTDTAFASDAKIPSSLAVSKMIASRVATATTTWTLKALGINPGGSSKSSVLNTAFSSSATKTLWAEATGDLPLTTTVNGQAKILKVDNGARFAGGAITNVLLDASPGVPVFDTSVAVTGLLNTDIYATNFGFSPTASAALNTRAIQRIAALINSMSGGVVLHIDKGTYIVGKETFAGAGGKGYSYAGELLFYIHDCTKQIIIEGNGATIKMANGLHFGSFDPVTGAIANIFMVVNHAGGYSIGNSITMAVQPLRSNCPVGTIALFTGGGKFTLTTAAAVGATTVTGNLTLANLADGATSGFNFTDYNYAAYPNIIFDLRNNNATSIQNLIIDGNVDNLAIGGGWDDDGIQLPADAMLTLDNTSFTAENVRAIHCARDALGVVNTVASISSPIKPVTVLNCVFDGNTRQAMSIVGCNKFYALNTSFINTGKTVNGVKGNNVRSSPAAGVDLEQETGIIRDITFENCLIDNNDGVGLLRVGNVEDVHWKGGRIIGATSWSLYGLSSSCTFENALIVGSPVNTFGAYFDNCTITLDTTLSPTGNVYGNYVLEMGGGGSPTFNHCIIDAARRGTSYGGSPTFINCTFKKDAITSFGYNGYSFMAGTFYGVTHNYYPGNPDNPNRTNSKFNGPFYVHNTSNSTITEISGLEPDTAIRAIIASRLIASGIENRHIDGTKDTIPLPASPVDSNAVKALAAKVVVDSSSVLDSANFFKSVTGIKVKNKADSTTTVSALALKAPLASPVFTGVPKIGSDTVAKLSDVRTMAGSGGINVSAWPYLYVTGGTSSSSSSVQQVTSFTVAYDNKTAWDGTNNQYIIPETGLYRIDIKGNGDYYAGGTTATLTIATGTSYSDTDPSTVRVRYVYNYDGSFSAVSFKIMQCTQGDAIKMYGGVINNGGRFIQEAMMSITRIR